MFLSSIRIRRWAPAAVMAVLALAPAARAQFGFNPKDLDPFNKNSGLRKELKKADPKDLDPLNKNSALNKELNKVDPTAALRRELEDARKRAMKDLRKLDPQEVFRRVQLAIQTRISRELQKSGVKYDARTGEADLRGTEMGKTLTRWLHDFAQGNKRAGQVEELSFNVKTKRLSVRLMARHCQSWGKVIPGQGEVELYSVTQRATFHYDFHKGSGDFDINLGPLAPRINTRTLEKLQEGDLVGIAESVAPEAVGKLWNHEEKNEYDQRVNQYHARYGAANVYFASRKFVGWAGPDTIGKYIISGVVTGGASVYPQIMHDLEKRAQEEAPALAAWLKRRGMANAESAAQQLLTGRTPSWPFLKFEMIPVSYSAREKPLHAVTTPWRTVNHLAFVIVWTDGGHSSAAKKELGINNEKVGMLAAKAIHVRFTNRAPHSVTLRLSGGKNETVVLPAGQERSFRVDVRPGFAPTVSFERTRGHSLALPLHDGGKYTLHQVRGELALARQ